MFVTWEFPEIVVPLYPWIIHVNRFFHYLYPWIIGFSIINHPFWGTPIYGKPLCCKVNKKPPFWRWIVPWCLCADWGCIWRRAMVAWLFAWCWPLVLSPEIRCEDVETSLFIFTQAENRGRGYFQARQPKKTAMVRAHPTLRQGEAGLSVVWGMQVAFFQAGTAEAPRDGP